MAFTTRKSAPICSPARRWAARREPLPIPQLRAVWDSRPPSLPSPAFRRAAILPARNITILAGQCNYLNQFLPVDQLHFCNNNFQNPYTQQWNLGFEHDLGQGWLFSHGLHRLAHHPYRATRRSEFAFAPSFVRRRDRRARLRPPTRPAPSFRCPADISQVLQYVNDGSAWYDGLQVAVNKQLTRRVVAARYLHLVARYQHRGVGRHRQNPN